MSIVAVPKPPRRQPKAKKPLPRPTQRIAKVNPTYKAKRVAKQRKHYASKEYRAARKEQIKAAGGQCEFWFAHRFNNGELLGHMRCEETERLEFHEEVYPSTIGIIRQSKGKIYCRRHHHLVDRLNNPTRSNGK